MSLYKKGDLIKLISKKKKLPNAPKVIIRKRQGNYKEPAKEPRTQDQLDYLARLAEKAKVPSLKIYEKVMAEQEALKQEAEKQLSSTEKVQQRAEDIAARDDQKLILETLLRATQAANRAAVVRPAPLPPPVLPARPVPVNIGPTSSIGPTSASPTGLSGPTFFVPVVPPPPVSLVPTPPPSGPRPSSPSSSGVASTRRTGYIPLSASSGALAANERIVNVDGVDYIYAMPPRLTPSKEGQFVKGLVARIKKANPVV